MKARLFGATLLLASAARAEGPPPPPAAAAKPSPALVILPSHGAPEPVPEADAIKVRINGEYELRQSFLTSLPLAPIGDEPPQLGQTARLYHVLRFRPLLLVRKHLELRAEADVPRGMIYGKEPEAVPNSGSDFERQQPVQLHARRLELVWRSRPGELRLGHAPAQVGFGLLDSDGDQPRYFGSADRPPTYERIELSSGSADSELRVGAAGDVLFDDGRLSLLAGDELWRVGLVARYAIRERMQLALLARYESLAERGDRGGAQAFVFDASGSFRVPIPGSEGELFGEYEAAYRSGDVSEPTAFATAGGEVGLASVGGAFRAGIALERATPQRRHAYLITSLEWGLASGDADPTDAQLLRFVMNPNHGVGLLLFSEVLRFKTSRAQALLARADAAAGTARLQGLATRGGVAGATYLNPVVLVRPTPSLLLKAGAVVASATSSVIDPAALARSGARQNFDGGSPLGRSLGSELDFGAELAIPLDSPMELRLSAEAGVAFPGSAFDDAEGRSLGTQAITTGGLGLTF